MLQPRLRGPLSALENSRLSVFCSSTSIFSHSPKKTPSLLPFLTLLRSAHHASEGRANGPRDRPGRRLGAKRSGEQYVIPGNIIFRQRGTKWFPGENCDIGRDHTIFAIEKGYVKYYKDPEKHPKRRYIGVAFDREDKLPYPRNAPRKRRLGMVAAPIEKEEQPVGGSKIKPLPVGGADSAFPDRKMSVGPGYVYRETNYAIGKYMDEQADKTRPYKKGDRWLAWRKKTGRMKRTAELRAQKAQKKAKKKVRATAFSQFQKQAT